MTTTNTPNVPIPAGAVYVDDWADLGHGDEFRLFTGPTWPIPGVQYSDDNNAAVVTIAGTQLADGTVEDRFIRVGGLHWDDELDAKTARTAARALLEAADELERLQGA